jgi:hypothetical protein
MENPETLQLWAHKTQNEDKQILKTKHRKLKDEDDPEYSRIVSSCCFLEDSRHWRHDVSSIDTIFTTVDHGRVRNIQPSMISIP